MPTAPKDKDIFSPRELRDAFSYDPDTGVITRKHDASNGPAKAGDIAGHKEKGGGRSRIRYRGSRILAHRAAWVIYYGVWPAEFLDHINGDEGDDRIENLREASHKENMRNRKTHSHSGTGVKGVALEDGRFSASISLDGVRQRLGRFGSSSEASAAYEKAAAALHGEFSSCTSRAPFI